MGTRQPAATEKPAQSGGITLDMNRAARDCLV